MANRGNIQKRDYLVDLLSRDAQYVSALPNGTTENTVNNFVRLDFGHDGYSILNYNFGLQNLVQPRDGDDRTSYQINQPFGFIGTSQPSPFNITGVTTYYKMRGYYLTGLVYETFVVTGSPSSTPPSGHILQDIAIVDTWKV